MSNSTSMGQPSRENGYRVYRFPEPARQAIGCRPAGETIRTFVERVVDERLPGLVAALTGVGVQDPGPSRPLRLPLSRTLLGRLCEAGRVTGLPASRLLLMVLTGPPLTAPSPKKPASKRSRPPGTGDGGGAGTRQKRAKSKAATPPTKKRSGRKPRRSGGQAVLDPAMSDAARGDSSDGLSGG